MFRRGHRARYIRVILKGSWKRVPMKLFKWGRKMPSKKEYDLVPEDEYDTRIPLHPEEAFQYGISFRAKYIGTMDVPRPTSRVEIVAAMRRVRYEFKARGVKKRKVTVDVSIDGVRITTTNVKPKRPRFFSRKKKKAPERIEIMHHPIYRIFYVSHDSSDLKIFSYIARDGATNVFKCNVFKSSKKNQAMKIVRTVGQAFEVCHKMQTNTLDNPVPSTSASDVVNEPAPKEPASECGASESVASTSKAADDPKAKPTRPKQLDLLPPAPKKDGKRVNQQISIPSINLPDLPECVTKVDVSVPEGDAATPLSSQHQVKLLRERLEQQSQQTQAAVAQLLLLRDQLAAEQAARCEAQARTHQLLVHNKELLEHIAALVSHLQEKEKGNSRPISAQQLTLLPQTNSGSNDGKKTENINSCNGNYEQINTNALISLIAKNYNITQNVENNNINLSPLPGSSSATVKQDGSSSPINFENMTNEQIQGYLISKFQDMNVTNGSESKEFFQNSKAFPDIPPLKNFSNSDLEKLLSNHFYMGNTNPDSDLNALVQAMSLAESQNSLYSSSPTSSSNSSPDDISSDDGASFIMPLSHNGTLAATGNDGRIRLIVPVSPSESISKVDELEAKNDGNATAGMTLTVPGTSSTLAPPAPITRSTSEKVPNRSELMSALRAQWTRHTTK
nr:carboxyl-terminal PDZ ligand of neuronal nitric oxide synthase protein isoform X3 [Danaus plexippus plexippus]